MGVSPRLGGALLIAAVLVAVPMTAPPGRSAPPATPVAFSSTGILTASPAGQAILHAANLGPGHSAQGQVTINYASSSEGRIELSQRLGSEARGLAGGSLFDDLNLTVEQVGGRADGLVYSGPMAAMGPTALQPFGPDESRTYSFTVLMPDHGQPSGPLAGDNANQGSSVTVDYVWTANSLDATGRRCSFGMLGTRGPDLLRADHRGVRILGRGGSDRIVGSRGADCLFGGPGSDLIRGRRGPDLLRGGPGQDVLRGGAGRDRIEADDDQPDRVHCGRGDDLAIIDPIDRVHGCETVIVR